MRIVKWSRFKVIEPDPPRAKDLVRSLARANTVINILHEMLARGEIDADFFSRKFFEWSLIKARLEIVLRNAGREVIVDDPEQGEGEIHEAPAEGRAGAMGPQGSR